MFGKSRGCFGLLLWHLHQSQITHHKNPASSRAQHRQPIRKIHLIASEAQAAHHKTPRHRERSVALRQMQGLPLITDGLPA